MLLLVLLSAVLGLGAACNNNRATRGRPDVRAEAPRPAAAPTPTLRIYYLVDLDGYLEPCGCQSRPLGGIDRLAHLMQRERSAAPHALFVTTGDLLFRDPQLDPRMVHQETAKAEAMVRILDQLGLVAAAPGPADFVRGADEWRRLVGAGHFVPVAANAQGDGGLQPLVVREVGGVRVGIVGVSDFRENPEATPPAGAPATTDPVAAARDAVARARQQGARVVVVLASTPRRVARTIAGEVPGVNFVIAAREEATQAPPPERVGDAYLLTAPNQGKGVGIVDIYRRDDGAVIVDASDATVAAERARLEARVADLRGRIAAWERDPNVDRAAVQQQRERLARMERELAAATGPRVPPRGSYFNARVEEVAPELAKRPDVERTIAAYFRAVNEHNRQAYAELRAPPPARGQAGYVGIEVCRDCHEDAYNVWTRTPHSRAYHTIEVISKNFNLSCVGCHVTGYQRPGGAEVVQNEGLRDVQCESCHGPGSLHVAARTDAQRRATIRREAPASLCATECHTPEHSDHFDYATYLPRVLGPGHGHPLDSDAGVQLSAPVLMGGATPPNTDLSTSDGGAAAH